MTQEQSVLLAVLRHSICPDMPLPDTDCDWESVSKEATQQAVSLIFYDAVAALMSQMPAPAQQMIAGAGMQVVAANINVGNAQQNLTKLLTEQNIPFFILKGEASAACYPKPQLRTLGDVDFLVNAEDFEKVHHIFQNSGYRFDDAQHDHHIAYHTPGGVLEMHKELPGIPSGNPGKEINAYLKGCLQRTRTLDIGSGPFPAPDAELHGLILLLHMQHHLVGEGIGLRHLTDWGCYVNSTHNEPFWEASLLPLLRRAGLFTFASIMTKLCALTFGTACPPWATANNTLCQEILEDILSGGNFGRKDDTRQASGLMMSPQDSKLKTLLKTFHASVKAHYPVCEKCGLLYIVFYPVRGIRYLWLMLTGKRESLIKAIPQANQRRDLYGQLHLFEVEENG